ncbi:MAG: hypothetical protein BWY53_00793 [Parcubacteria group bacterium ADurb.Bin326]|nr:MAG: hypothetical protein BWY53_00793 [Parcubacteria group bacterium ADurb.Bin326]
MFFDVYSKSRATYGSSYYEDKCLIDICSGNTCANTPVESCSPGDRNCRLQEGFVFYPPQSTSTPRVANWLYPCPNGCSAGACVKTPVCTDSDLSSNETFPYPSGSSHPFIKGMTKGMLNGAITTVYDYCSSSTRSTLIEFYCNSGNVAKTEILCKNGCTDGACNAYADKVSIGEVFKGSIQSEVYFYGKDKKKHLFPNSAVYKTWYKDFSNLKVVKQEVSDKIPVGSIVTVRPVGYILKFTNEPAYYFVMTSNQLKKFNDEKTIAKFFGTDWKSRVVEVAPSFKKSYRILLSPIKENDKYPNGSIVRLDGYIGIFYIQSDKIRTFGNSDIFLKNNLDDSLVASAYSSSSIAYPEGSMINTVESRFVAPY